MKNIKLHVCVMLMIVIAELIGVKSFSVGPGKIVLLPMLYAHAPHGPLWDPCGTNLAQDHQRQSGLDFTGIWKLGHRPCRGTACRVLWTQAGNHRCGPFHSP